MEIAEKLNTSQQIVSQLLNEKRAFGLKSAQLWHDVFGFRINWLRTGEGPMFEGQTVTNNTSGGDMIINSPGAVTGSSDGADVRVYKDLYDKAQAEIITLKAKIYQLMDKLTENGIDCDC